VFLLLLGCIFATREDRVRVTIFESVIRDTAAPVQACLTRLVHGVGTYVSVIQNIPELTMENKRLREEVAQLKGQVIELSELRRQNAVLRELLGFKHRNQYDLLPAEVIARVPVAWDESLVINRGEADGVSDQFPVITCEGIVGYTVSLTRHTAEVMLLSDSRFAAGGMVQRTSEFVVVGGMPDSDGGVYLRPISTDADIRVGDTVVTSGLSKVFPKGLAIGEVVEVRKDAFGRCEKARIVPLVSLDDLEYVFVLLPGGRSTGEADPDA